MSAFTPASEVLLRHSSDFEQSRILLTGDLQDDLPIHLNTAASRAHTQQFHHWRVLGRQMGDNARFSLVAMVDDVVDCDTLIYYWPRNKPGTQFRSMNLLSLLPVGTDIFVVGENRSGVRSAEQMLTDYTPLNRVDNARRCGLYFDHLEKRPIFDANKPWGEYSVDGLAAKTLPDVFSCDGLDVSNRLLLLTLTSHTKDKVLDVSCGADVLSVAFARHSPRIHLTLCDVSAPAVKTSRTTLAASGVEGEIFANNVLSEVEDRLNMIISNPPFRDGMQTNLDVAQTLIRDAVRHLSSGDELRVVVNAFLPYPDVLDEIFGFHEVIV